MESPKSWASSNKTIKSCKISFMSINTVSNRGIGILGVNHYLPQVIQTNEELCAIINDEELTPEWILTKTGIKRRYHVSKDETATSMAFDAAKKVLEKHPVDPKEIGLVVVASFSQDYLFP